MPSKSTRSIVLYADTRRSADQLYFGKVEVPDPFLSFSARGKRVAVVSALEFGRVKRTSAFDEVLPLERWMGKVRDQFSGPPRPGPAELISVLAKEYRLGGLLVSADFPAALYARMRTLGVDVEVAEGPSLFPSRDIKTPAEAKAIAQGNACSSAGFSAAEAVLRESRVRQGRLMYRGAELTSERLRFAIEAAVLEAGGISLDTICAGGDQACDPHERGSGPIRPGELIIIDIFPRHIATGYYGDMTRTYLKGRASDAQRRLVHTVYEAQKLALSKMRADASGRAVHCAVAEFFTAQGYETKTGPKGSVGYFHGTGHGLGLEVHEMPRMSPTIDYPLPRGAVMTVEPGLYYPGLGGARVEDVVQIMTGKPKFLSEHSYEWELR